MARILLVDTDRQFLFMMRDAIAKIGHEVFCATEFATAVTIAQQNNIQLVLLNSTMGTGVITGLDLAHALAIIDPTLPVVMLGVRDDSLPVMQALRLKFLTLTHRDAAHQLETAISRYSRHLNN